MSNDYVGIVLSLEGVLKWADFLREGWEQLKSINHGRGSISCDQFFKLCLHVASRPNSEGVIVVFTSKNDKPLGYMIAMNNTEMFSEERTALIYAGYSNGKYARAAVDGTAFIEAWARRYGYKQLQAHTRRMHGGSVKLFERKLGFEPLSWVYKKDL